MGQFCTLWVNRQAIDITHRVNFETGFKDSQ